VILSSLSNKKRWKKQLMEEFELQQQPYYSKLLLGSPLEIANVDDSDLQLVAGVPSDPPPAPPTAVKKKKKRSLPGTPGAYICSPLS
jgi:hypothetical protein